MACQWFGLKPITTVSWFGSQNQGRRFGDLGLKTTAAVSWLGPQNQGRWFGDLGLKITTTVFLVWASKPSGRRFIGLHFQTDERMKMV
jgi:hypothetical protein